MRGHCAALRRFGTDVGQILFPTGVRGLVEAPSVSGNDTDTSPRWETDRRLAWLVRYLPMCAFVVVFAFTSYLGALALLFAPRSFDALVQYFSGAHLPKLDAIHLARVLLLLNVPVATLIAGFAWSVTGRRQSRFTNSVSRLFAPVPIALAGLLFAACLAAALWAILASGATHQLQSWFNYAEWVYARERLMHRVGFIGFVNIYVFLPVTGALLALELLSNYGKTGSGWLAALVVLAVAAVNLLIFQKKALIAALLLYLSAWVLWRVFSANGLEGATTARRLTKYALGALVGIYALYEALVVIPVVSTSSEAVTSQGTAGSLAGGIATPAGSAYGSRTQNVSLVHSLRLALMSDLRRMSPQTLRLLGLCLVLGVVALIWWRFSARLPKPRWNTKRIAPLVVAFVALTAVAGIGSVLRAHSAGLQERPQVQTEVLSVTKFLADKHTLAVVLYSTLAPFTRTSAPAIMYAATYPDLHPFYGLDLGQDILGFGTMPDDNSFVWHVLYPDTPGGAVAAPFQFVWYSQVGLLGTVILSGVLGVVIGWLWRTGVLAVKTPSALRAVSGAAIVLWCIYIAIDSVRNSLIVSYGVVWVVLPLAAAVVLRLLMEACSRSFARPGSAGASGSNIGAELKIKRLTRDV